MLHIGVSGGATRFVGLFEATKALYDSGYVADIYSGISAGGYVAICFAMGLMDEVDKFTKALDINEIFSKNPLGKIGGFSITGIIRLICGKKGAGVMGNLERNIREIIKKDDFEKWQLSDRPRCIIGMIDYKTKQKFYVDLKDPQVDYETAIKFLLATGSIPFYSEPVELNWHGKDLILLDGGVRDHCASPYVLENINGITKSISIYSRPKNEVDEPNWDGDNALDYLERTIAIYNYDVSKNDESDETVIANMLGIQHKIYYLPRVLEGLYDTDKNRLKELAFLSKNLVLSNLPDFDNQS